MWHSVDLEMPAKPGPGGSDTLARIAMNTVSHARSKLVWLCLLMGLASFWFAHASEASDEPKLSLLAVSHYRQQDMDQTLALGEALGAELLFGGPVCVGFCDVLFRIDETTAPRLTSILATSSGCRGGLEAADCYGYLGDRCWGKDCANSPVLVHVVFDRGYLVDSFRSDVEALGANFDDGGVLYSGTATFHAPTASLQAISDLQPVDHVGLFPRGGNTPEAQFYPVEAFLGSGQRFSVITSYSVEGLSRLGFAQPMTRDSAAFSFFDRENIELNVKVLDGCSVNGHYWVFAAGMTDVGVELQVHDLDSGTLVSYSNPEGIVFRSVRDTEAFLCSK